jgi:hypothetical protein
MPAKRKSHASSQGSGGSKPKRKASASSHGSGGSKPKRKASASSHGSGGSKPKRKPKRKSTGPKRPLNAYMRFAAAHRHDAAIKSLLVVQQAKALGALYQKAKAAKSAEYQKCQSEYESAKAAFDRKSGK